jgi:hypothetical protein
LKNHPLTMTKAPKIFCHNDKTSVIFCFRRQKVFFYRGESVSPINCHFWLLYHFFHVNNKIRRGKNIFHNTQSTPKAHPITHLIKTNTPLCFYRPNLKGGRGEQPTAPRQGASIKKSARSGASKLHSIQKM